MLVGVRRVAAVARGLVDAGPDPLPAVLPLVPGATEGALGGPARPLRQRVEGQVARGQKRAQAGREVDLGNSKVISHVKRIKW